jgi:hypothetical protein
MESKKKVIVGKISARRTSYCPQKDEVLIATEDGKIVDVIRASGTVILTRGENTEWFFVDCSEAQYDLAYSGGIEFRFSFVAAVTFPTLLIARGDLLGKDMAEIVTAWAESSYISNTVTELLRKMHIDSEKQLFEGNGCERIERALMVECREHFIKSWGMMIEAVKIRKKCTVKLPAKREKSTYDYIF